MKLGINAFGPSKNAAQLEGSKNFSRNFCERHNIPQPEFKYCTNIDSAKKQIVFLFRCLCLCCLLFNSSPINSLNKSKEVSNAI